MKRTAFILAALLLLSSAAHAECCRTLSISAEATGELEPDVMNITLSVETTAATAKESAAENARKMDKVVSAVKQALGDKDRVSTSSYSLSPVYQYEKDRGQVLTGFQTANRIKVRSSRIKSAGDILDRAIEAGANVVNEVSFDSEDSSKACEVLIKKVSAEAAANARITADAFGAKLSGIESLRPSCGREVNYVRPMGVEFAKAETTPIEAEAIRVRAFVNASYILAE